MAKQELPAREVYSLAQLLALQDSGDRWLIDKVIPTSGRVIIFGPGGLGKTTLVMDLALSVATGSPFLGEVPVAKTGPVLMLSTEGDKFSNRDRFQGLVNAHEVSPDAPLYYMQEPLVLEEPGDRAALLDLLNDIKPVLVILDPLDSFFWGEENSASATKPFRHFVNAAIQAFKTTFLVIHHAAAKEEPGQLNKPRGTTAWFGWADTVIRGQIDQRRQGREMIVWQVTKQRNGRKMEWLKVAPHYELDKDPPMLSFDVGETLEAHAVTANKVLEVLRAAGQPLSQTALRTLVGGRTTTLRAALRDLAQRKVIVNEPVDIPTSDGKPRRGRGWALAPGAPAPDAPGSNGTAVHAAAVQPAQPGPGLVTRRLPPMPGVVAAPAYLPTPPELREAADELN